MDLPLHLEILANESVIAFLWPAVSKPAPVAMEEK
jgi:hypothetical protein